MVALNGITLELQRGETHIILGENGAGKSTLIKLLAGIYQPDTGEIFLNGRPYKPKTPHDAQVQESASFIRNSTCCRIFPLPKT